MSSKNTYRAQKVIGSFKKLAPCSLRVHILVMKKGPLWGRSSCIAPYGEYPPPPWSHFSSGSPLKRQVASWLHALISIKIWCSDWLSNFFWITCGLKGPLINLQEGSLLCTPCKF